jgi:hypothetical protein
MRSVGAAGWSQHGYFGLTAKTFGNPTGASSGDGGVPTPGGGPENAVIGQFVAGNGGILMGGFLGATSSTQFTAVRFNTVFDNLATQADTPIANLANGVVFTWFANGNFIIQDGSGTLANDFGDGLAWALAINPDGASAGNPYGLAFDVLHGKVVLADQNSTNIYTSANTTPLTLAASATTALAPFGSVGYRGTGVLLAAETGGGAGPQIWQSTDGGATWAAVAASPFVGSAGTFIGFGATQWLALGGAPATGALQYSVSTDDGVTWSAAVDLPGDISSGGDAVSVATDGANNWVILNNSLGGTPGAYWVSNDDGSTWVAPGTFTAQSGTVPGSLIHDGAEWLASWLDATGEFNFLSSSVDGRTWSVGPAVREPT